MPDTHYTYFMLSCTVNAKLLNKGMEMIATKIMDDVRESLLGALLSEREFLL